MIHLKGYACFWFTYENFVCIPRVCVQVVERSGYGADKFEMERNTDGTGALRVVKPLDYEEQNKNNPIRFKIEVKDTVSMFDAFFIG